MKMIAYALYLAATVYGHVALKLAVDRSEGTLRAATSAWGISAIVAWGASAFVWMKALEHDTLVAANTVSTLRYVLVLAASALVLREAIDTRTAIGSVFVVVGVWLVAVR
jgi:uncharacterized membrane protein